MGLPPSPRHTGSSVKCWNPCSKERADLVSKTTTLICSGRPSPTVVTLPKRRTLSPAMSCCATQAREVPLHPRLRPPPSARSRPRSDSSHTPRSSDKSETKSEKSASVSHGVRAEWPERLTRPGLPCHDAVVGRDNCCVLTGVKEDLEAAHLASKQDKLVRSDSETTHGADPRPTSERICSRALRVCLSRTSRPGVRFIPTMYNRHAIAFFPNSARDCALVRWLSG